MKFPRVPTGLASHPYRVSGLARLPDSLRPLVDQVAGSSDAIATIVVVPAQLFTKGWARWRYEPEQALVFTRSGVWQLQAAFGAHQSGQVSFLAGAGLLYVEIRLILLYGRIEIVGTDASNQMVKRQVIEFNTVGWHLFQQPIIDLLRLAWAPLVPAYPNVVLTKAGTIGLEELPLKYRNGLMLYALPQGERLLGLIFQPGVWTRHWHFFRRQIVPNALLALTDHELIVVADEHTQRGISHSYGWIITHFPQASITGFGVSAHDLYCDLQVNTARGAAGETYHILLGQGQAEAWQVLWNQYHPG